MSAKLHTLAIRKDRKSPDQIQAHLRSLIQSGELVPGERLPSIRQMARLWQTHVATVHAGLERLASQNLITTLPNKGVFVRRPEQRLTCAGIYFGENIWEQDWAGYQRAFYFAVKEQLAVRGIETRLLADTRPLQEQGTPFAPLVKAVDRHEVQALVAAGCTPLHLPWFESLGIPLAFSSTLDVPYRVRVDERQMLELSFRYLKEQGCRSVGVIVPTHPPSHVEPVYERNVFFEELVQVAGDMGLELHNEWIHLPAQPGCTDARQELFGYERFRQLWQLPKRPDGLLVHPDSVVRGVMLAMLEFGVRVPEQVQVVFHRNAEVNLFYPLPVAWITSSVRAMARAVIQQIDRQLRGEACHPITLGFTLQPPVSR